jgi:hypothetical protein
MIVLATARVPVLPNLNILKPDLLALTGRQKLKAILS